MTSTLITHRASARQPASFYPSPHSSRGDLRLAVRFTIALAVVAGIASVVGAFFPSVFRDAPVTVGNAQGTAVVLLLVGLPVLLIATGIAIRGSRRALIVWLGTLFYVLYNSVMFTFAAMFNSLFLVNVATLSLAVWSVVALLRRIDLETMPEWFDRRLPARSIAIFLMVTAVAFGALWLADVLPAIVANSAPASLRGTRFNTNPVEILDLGFTLPLCAVAAVWLWSGRGLGYLLSGALLVMLTIECLGIAVDQWFGHLYDATQPLGTVPMFVMIAAVNGVATLVFLRRLVARAA